MFSTLNERNNNLNKIDYSKVLPRAIFSALLQFNPVYMIKNPTMFIVEICFILMILLTIKPSLFGPSNLTQQVNFIILMLLFFILFLGNLAENIAKEMAKAQLESLKIIHGDVEVKRLLQDGGIEYVFSSQLQKGDLIKVQEGDLVPLDGEVVEGVATVDESPITGESSPVLKEPGTDTSSSVTGGTRVLTDSLLVKITSEQGQTYIDQMVNIAEEAERHKSPNELSLNSLLIASTISFLLVVLVLAGILYYLKLEVEITYLIALLVCLLPTTIGSLIIPIRISSLKKINAFNILAISEKAIDNAGDIDALFVDKTGTITFGNRMAIEFIPLGTNSLNEVIKTAYLASCFDQTPEGKSILSLAKRNGLDIDIDLIKGTPYEFTAHTRMSGIDLETGDIIRKGASDAIKKFVSKKDGKIWDNTDQIVENIASQGGTPLLISKNNSVIGVIHLKDMIKPGIKEQFNKLNILGIKTIMCTGDNPLTAKVIAKEAGINDYIAQARPEDKIHLIKEYQTNGLMVSMTGDGTNDAPALAQADIGLAMNSGTIAAKEAANMIDLDSDPTKIIEIIKIGRYMLSTKGALTTFSVTNDISKYFAILPSLLTIEGLQIFNIMHLESPFSAIVSTMIFSTLIIGIMTPIALKGITVKNIAPNKTLETNLLTFGLGGLIVPFIGIKVIDLLIGRFI